MDQPTSPAPPQRSLTHYVELIRRSWTFIVIPAVVAMTMAFVLSSRSEDVFVSSSTVRVSDPGSTVTVGGRSASEIDRQLATSVEILGSSPVRERVLRGVPRAVSDAFRAFSTRRIGETVLVEIEVRANDPDAAQRIAQKWAETYVDLERTQAVAGLTERAKALREQAVILQPEIDDLDRRIASLTPDASTGAAPPTLSPLLTERQALFDEQNEYRLRAIDFDIEAALREGAIALVVPADDAGPPVAPKPLRTTALAMVLGLILGIALAVLRDELDTRVRGRDGLRALLPNIPILAAIPRLHRPHAPATETHLSTEEGWVEAFRSLATSIEFMAGSASKPRSDRARILVVTSANEGDGKTTVVANLGLALAAIGRRVVLVNADLRNGDLHVSMEAEEGPGIAEVLLDGLHPIAALQTVLTGGHSDLRLLSSGRRVADPVTLLSSAGFAEVIDTFALVTDYVLIDAPPVLPVTDTLVLSRVADAAVLVVADGKTNSRQVNRSVESLQQVGFAILGAVLSGGRFREAPYGPPLAPSEIQAPSETAAVEGDGANGGTESTEGTEGTEGTLDPPEPGPNGAGSPTPLLPPLPRRPGARPRRAKS